MSFNFLMQIWGKKEHFVMKNERSPEEMHQSIRFSTTASPCNQQAKIFSKAKIIQHSLIRSLLGVIICYFHFTYISLFFSVIFKEKFVFLT